jgi:hypothetical protein
MVRLGQEPLYLWVLPWRVGVNQDPHSAQYYNPRRGQAEIITKTASAGYHGEFNTTFRDSSMVRRTLAKSPALIPLVVCSSVRASSFERQLFVAGCPL